MQLIAIQQKIYNLRGHRVMLDFDLAELYQVETRVLNQSVKRNSKRFPGNFMFQLKAEEWKELSSSQIVMMDSIPRNRTGRYLPYAFTEHGVTMLASVLNSDHAIAMNIAIVNAFIALREFAANYAILADQVQVIRQKVDNHSEQLNLIYEAIENMLDEKEERKSWEERNRIGFRSAAE
jgi:hypothetical protein